VCEALYKFPILLLAKYDNKRKNSSKSTFLTQSTRNRAPFLIVRGPENIYDIYKAQQQRSEIIGLVQKSWPNFKSKNLFKEPEPSYSV